MASLGHLAVGIGTARWSDGDEARAPLAFGIAALGWSALSMLPDLDVMGFRFGVRYSDPWGHRGATHSFGFAVGVGLLLGLTAWLSGRRFLRPAVLGALVVASHGVLDTLTDGGLGCALLWPFSDARFFAPFRPIPVAPIGRAFLSFRGLFVLGFEAVLFGPLLLYGLWPRRAGRRDKVAAL